MKKLNSFLNSLKKIMTYGERIRPERDWSLLLLVVIILLVISVGWNIFLFNQFQNVKSPTSSTTPEAVNKVGASISQIQSIFQQRATEEENYQKTYHFVDPSLPGA